jgi:hypothetical protein
MCSSFSANFLVAKKGTENGSANNTLSEAASCSVLVQSTSSWTALTLTRHLRNERLRGHPHGLHHRTISESITSTSLTLRVCHTLWTEAAYVQSYDRLPTLSRHFEMERSAFLPIFPKDELAGLYLGLLHEVERFHDVVDRDLADRDGLGPHALRIYPLPPEGLVSEERNHSGRTLRLEARCGRTRPAVVDLQGGWELSRDDGQRFSGLAQVLGVAGGILKILRMASRRSQEGNVLQLFSKKPATFSTQRTLRSW